MAQETLSALLDGECSSEELDRLLDEMDRDPELKSAWSRLCLSREAAEGTRYRQDQPCICAGVMAQLDPQPAPVARSQALQAGPRARSQTARRRRAWAPMAGWAVAASVAVVAVALNYGGTGRESTVAGPGLMPQIDTTSVGVPAVQRRPRYLQAVSATSDQLNPAAQEDLRQYLIEHSNTLADRGMGGSLSYARFAAHTAEARSEAPADPVVPATGDQP